MDELRLPIIQFWNTSEVPSDIAELSDTFGEHNPDLPHLMFDELRAEGLIAEHFGTRELTAFRACAVPAMQADYFRYCAALVLGGIHVDADIRCIAPLRPLIDRTAVAMLVERRKHPQGLLWPHPHPTIINGFFIFRSPGHPLLKLALDIATVNIEQRVVESVWAATGPGIFTSLYVLHKLGSVDAFIRFSAEHPERARPMTAAGHRRWVEVSAKVICEVAGSASRASAAFAGASFEPERDAEDYVSVVKEMPYKATDSHWLRREGSIYRPRRPAEPRVREDPPRGPFVEPDER